MGVERTAISGGSVIALCDGLDVGWATGLDGEIVMEVREARTLGSIDPRELKIVRRSVTFNLRTLRIPGLSGAVLGWMPEGDSLAMVRLKPLLFEVKDEDSGKIIRRIYGCKPTSLRFQVEEGSFYQENGSWRGMLSAPGDR